MEDPTRMLLNVLDERGRALHALLTRLTLREDVAEDLMQELFIKLSRSGGFAGAKNPAAYATRAAMNLAFDWRRSRQRRPATETVTAEPVAGDPSPLSKLIHDEQVHHVLDAAGRLRRTCRDAFIMRHIQQESYETIAKYLGKSPHQVRALCYKAVREIRALVSRRHRELGRKEESRVRY